MAAQTGDLEEAIERLITEGLASLSQAARLLPAVRGRRRHSSTIHRWIVRGKRGVHLEGFQGADGTWWTSRPALARFFAQLTRQNLATPTVLPGEAARQARAAAARAALELVGKTGKRKASGRGART